MSAATAGFVPEHLHLTPELERAMALNSAMIDLALEREGIRKCDWNKITLLREASLAELVDSQRLIKDYDARPQQSGSRTVHMKCDDRLIAAVYCFLHYAVPPAMRQGEDDYVILKVSDHGRIAFLLCGQRDKKDIEDEEGDDE